jgi:type II secretory pathway component GspD/PulD (secretin)
MRGKAKQNSARVHRPEIRRATALGVIVLLLSLVACQQPEPAPGPKPAPRVRYSPKYDPDIQEITRLASQGRWEEAQAKADALASQAPNDPAVQRVQVWVAREGQRARQQALEAKIRQVDAKYSVFNPTLKSLVTEQKDRGLPPRKDVRDTVSRIENSPYIPDTYDKTIHEQGPMFDLDTNKGRMSRLLDKQISIHLDNVPLGTILIHISQSTGINIVADKSLPALKQNLTVNLDNVKLGEFLHYVSRNYDLQFQVGDQLVWVTAGKDSKDLMEQTRFYRLRKGFVLPAEFGADQVVKTFTTGANHVTTEKQTANYKRFVNDEAPETPGLEQAIEKFFKGSKWIIDYEHNLIVARGTPEQLDTLRQIIEQYDRPIPQVLIEARFVTVTKPAFLQLGALWETGRQSPEVRTPQDFTGMLHTENVPSVGIGIQKLFPHVLGAADLSATISALEQSGESQTLSEPRLTVLNNRPATISDGKVQFYYQQYTVQTRALLYYQSSSFVPTGKPTRVTAGAELNVLASVSADGKSILLALNPTINTDVQLVRYATLSDYDSSGKLQDTFDINLPQYRTESLATRVTVKSGQTVVMGGVLERERSTYVESVPVLGDIPYLGVLFRRRTEIDTPRYLLIFVTATILTDSGEYLVYDDTPNSNSASATNSPPKISSPPSDPGPAPGTH